MDTAGRRGNPSQLETDVARVRRNVDTVESRRNGPQLSMRHDDDDDDDDDCYDAVCWVTHGTSGS